MLTLRRAARGALRRAAARLRAEGGFSLVVVLAVLTVGTLFTLVAISAADGDIQSARADQDGKIAYAAAEAGVADYRAKLEKDPEVYKRCTNLAAPTNGQPSPVAQRWSGTGTDTRDGHWRDVPGSSADYSIELLPAPGYTTCVENAGSTMFDWRTGTFSIRSTGRSSCPPPAGEPQRCQTRSIVATFRRKGFTDYVYFTDYETVDPQLVAYETGRSPSANDALCAKYAHGPDPRPSGFSGQTCRDIPFIGNDKVNGPAHTNDRFAFFYCGAGSPMTMGRSAEDRIGSVGPTSVNYNCTPTFPGGGQLHHSEPSVTVPPTLSSTEFASTVQADHAYVGATKIVLNYTSPTNKSYTVTNASVNGGAPWTKPLPSNGLIYVTNGAGCTSTYNPEAPYTNEQAACADVRVQGTYWDGLTIASQKDVIVTGNLIRADDAPGIMGLIAEQYVRVYHPLTNNATCPRTNAPARTNAVNSPPGVTSPRNIRIDAALLALQHSFTVDNHNCGQNLGVMTVNGTIAQKYRGYVFSNGNEGNENPDDSGYYKNYVYDERMRTGGPPSFVSPTGSPWRTLRYNEQVPAR